MPRRNGQQHKPKRDKERKETDWNTEESKIFPGVSDSDSNGSELRTWPRRSGQKQSRWTAHPGPGFDPAANTTDVYAFVQVENGG
jgi:hypothetical protein